MFPLSYFPITKPLGSVSREREPRGSYSVVFHLSRCSHFALHSRRTLSGCYNPQMMSQQYVRSGRCGASANRSEHLDKTPTYPWVSPIRLGLGKWLRCDKFVFQSQESEV